MSDMTKICGLWKNEKNGKVYFSGRVKAEDLAAAPEGDMKVLIFENTYKRESRHPDYNLFFAPDERQESRQDSRRAENRGRGGQRSYAPPPPEEEVPF